jgi:hypothetical protein
VAFFKVAVTVTVPVPPEGLKVILFPATTFATPDAAALLHPTVPALSVAVRTWPGVVEPYTWNVPDTRRLANPNNPVFVWVFELTLIGAATFGDGGLEGAGVYPVV